MADAFSPDLFSEFKRTSSPQSGRGAGKRGRGFGKRGRGGVKQRSVNTPHEILVPPDLAPEIKRKRRNTSDTVSDLPTTSQSVGALSNDEQDDMVRTRIYNGLSLVGTDSTYDLVSYTARSIVYSSIRQSL